MSSERSMPDFIGIGAQKAGTAWLYACLTEHPQICAARSANGNIKKETHYFDTPVTNISSYQAYFAHCQEGTVAGEMTPRYLFLEGAPARISAVVPNVKLIAILRHPVYRAYSQFKYLHARGGGVAGTFKEAIIEHPELVERGLYGQQLARYLHYFSRDQIFVGLYDDMCEDPVTFIQQIYRFLGLDDTFVPNQIYGRRNVSKSVAYKSELAESVRRSIRNKLAKYPTLKRVGKYLRARNIERAIQRRNLILITSSNTAADIDKETWEYLMEYYAADIKRLEFILGRNLIQWK
jgi:hypothetical protein